MDINIEGNPGAGNTFQQINIQHVDHYNTQPVTINNNYYGGCPDLQVNAYTPHANANNTNHLVAGRLEQIDTAPIRKEIMNLISCVRPLLKDECKTHYMQMWDDILCLDVVEAAVYNPGKQRNTNFNRKLIASILHLLDSKKMYRDPYNATTITKALGYSIEHSVRRELAVYPPDNITNAINKLISTKKYI